MKTQDEIEKIFVDADMNGVDVRNSTADVMRILDDVNRNLLQECEDILRDVFVGNISIMQGLRKVDKLRRKYEKQTQKS